jgi:hypothetical protein
LLKIIVQWMTQPTGGCRGFGAGFIDVHKRFVNDLAYGQRLARRDAAEIGFSPRECGFHA